MDDIKAVLPTMVCCESIYMCVYVCMNEFVFEYFVMC